MRCARIFKKIGIAGSTRHAVASFFCRALLSAKTRAEMIFPLQVGTISIMKYVYKTRKMQTNYILTKMVYECSSWLYSDGKWCTDSFLSFEQWIFHLLYCSGWNCELLRIRWNMLYFVFGKDIKHFIAVHFVEYIHKRNLWHQNYSGQQCNLLGWLNFCQG